MKKIILIISLLIITISLNGQSLETSFNGNNYVLIGNDWHLFISDGNKLIKTDGHLYLKSYSMGIQEINYLTTQYNLTHVETAYSYFHVFSLDSAHKLLSVAKSIDSLSYINLTEIGVLIEYHSTPNDPYYPIGTNTGQWNLYTGNGMGVDSAWDITTGDSNLVVMVIDRGVNYYHPDLGMGIDGYENIYKNTNEDPWIAPISSVTGNGVGDSIDNDGNGYIDDWKGWNFHVNYPQGTKDANWYPDLIHAPNSHGTACAGIIAAKTNNGTGVSGIAGGWGNRGVQIMPINMGPRPALLYSVKKGIEYGIKMKVDIINMSFGVGSHHVYQYIDTVLKQAYDAGIILVVSAGNETKTKVQYPANSKYAIGVGAHNYNSVRESYSNYGELLDIMAPSSAKSTSYNGRYTNFTHTSAAAPQVAGVIALMKSVNKCLSPDEAFDIIKSTAIKSGGYNYNWSSSKPGHSKQFGYGRVNAHEAVKLAQSTQSNTVDLYIKDDHEDFGVEPNIYSNIFYLSPDIWIRNLNDKKETHQNPEYDPVSPVYVNVKVRNKSCVSSSGTDTLYIHWNKAGTHLGWPGSWNGSTSSPMLGNVIDSIIIPVIPAGKDTILTLPWVIPNPQDYTSVASDVWHFCLLARIKSSTDLYHTPESSDFDANLKHNNNVALKNVTVVDSISSVGGSSGGSIRKYSGTIAVGNSFGEPKSFNFSFSSPNDDLVNATDIVLEVDDALFTKLANSNTPPTFIEDNKILISENNFVLQNVDFAANEISTINLTFFFKSDVDITQDEFRLYVNQIDVSTSKVTGGELFVIYPPKDNADINADAGDDQTANSDDQITLSADYVAGNVEYKWFDEEGNIVAEGMDLTVNIDASEMFQLIVFDLENGISDDDYVNVTVDDNEIKTISPNPTSTGQIQVEYNIDGSTNAYLMVVENGIIRNYVVTNTTSKIIQTNNFCNGTHTILLICDGVIKDVKQFIKI